MQTDRLLTKPLQGGLFGEGVFALASMPCVARGLHSVRYMVIQPRAGTVLAVAEDKGEALAAARRVLIAAGDLAAANDEGTPSQPMLWPEAEMPVPATRAATNAPVSRRRREVWSKCNGRCHYCGTQVDIETFEVEHMKPRALGGGDDPLNLVAACRKCNREKSDRTALEFVARGAAR